MLGCHVTALVSCRCGTMSVRYGFGTASVRYGMVRRRYGVFKYGSVLSRCRRSSGRALSLHGRGTMFKVLLLTT